MPMVRYEIRNEYSLANPELYRSAAKDEPEALLEGVAMAGLVGIVRQLGDLADFAAEIFHDLHEVVMATAARSHELMIRVQQLEAEIPSIENGLMSETNQLRFAYTIGADWHASIRNDQNHLTQGDLPQFIRNSYEECRGPPRLFLLDRFDVAGIGACLKRYTDPSFFKMAWANSQFKKTEKGQRERSIVRVKKKIRRRRNGDTAEIAAMLQHDSRVHYSSVDLNGLMGTSRNSLNISNRRLRSKWVNGSQQSQVLGKTSMHGSFNLSASKENPQDRLLSQQWKRKPMAAMVHEAQMMNSLATGGAPKLQSMKLSAKDIEAGMMAINIMHGEQRVVFIDGESKPEGPADVGRMDDAGSETDNFVDALTTMDSEIETDYEYQIKHEADSDFNSDHRGKRSETTEDSRAEHAECCVIADAEAPENICNVESPDDSAKVVTCIRLYNTESANGLGNVKSAPCIVNAPSEDNFEIVEPAASFPSVHTSAECRHNEPLADLGNGKIFVTVENIPSSSGINTIQECNTANEEALSDHVNASSFATAADCASATSDNYVQAPDVVLNRSFSFAFTSSEPSAVHRCAESRNNESIGDLDSGTVSATGGNITSSKSKDTFQKQDPTFATAANFESCANNSEAKTSDAILNRSSSFAFANFVPSDVSLNATPAWSDDTEAFFRFTTPELCIMYNDVKSSSAATNEELFTKTKSSAGVTDIKLQICSPNIEIPCNPSVPLVSTDFNTIESASVSYAAEVISGLHDAAVQEEHASADELDSCLPSLFTDSSRGGLSSSSSEFASGSLDVMIQEKHQGIDLQVDCPENEIPVGCVSNENTYSRLELSTGFSSMTSAGCTCAQSEGQIINSGSPVDCMHARPSTLPSVDTSSTCASSDMLGSGMHAESVGNQAPAVLPTEDVLHTKSLIMKAEPADPAYTISRLPVMPVELLPAMENSEVLEHVPLPAESSSRESSGDLSGDKLTATFENLKFDVNVLKEDLNDSMPPDGIPVDLAQAELADVGCSESLSGSSSSATFCKELPPNKFTQAEVEGFLSAKDPNGCRNTMPTIAASHSSLSTASTDTGSYEFVNSEPHANLRAEEHAMVPTNSPDVEVPTNSICNKLGIEYLSVELPMNFVVEPCSAFANVGSSPTISHMEACPHELCSPPPEHVLSSNPATRLLHSPCYSNREYVPETPNPERNSLEFLTECSSQPVTFMPETTVTTGPTVFSGIAMHSDKSFHSPRIAIALSTSLVDKSSPIMPREAILPNFEYMHANLGSSSPQSSDIFIVSSSSSPIFNALDSSMPQLRISGDTQAFSKCQSTDLEFEILAPSSPTTEPSFQGGNSIETPPPPPLPPLEWQTTRLYQSSCSQNTKLIEFPASPPPPIKPDSLAKNTFSPSLVPGTEKIYIERNDSLIKAIASHDKSTLRKVIQQTQSVKPKPLNEREELLEQIRNRAFNLRHTVVKKHEIPQPATNINVSAILEKAAAIRQAFVGSEDDEDGDWSDA